MRVHNTEALRAAIRKFYGYGLESRDVDQFLKPMQEAIEVYAAESAKASIVLSEYDVWTCPMGGVKEGRAVGGAVKLLEDLAKTWLFAAGDVLHPSSEDRASALAFCANELLDAIREKDGRAAKCPDCHGAGVHWAKGTKAHHIKPITCEVCKGSGSQSEQPAGGAADALAAFDAELDKAMLIGATANPQRFAAVRDLYIVALRAQAAQDEPELANQATNIRTVRER